jgi:hypothetical protein
LTPALTAPLDQLTELVEVIKFNLQLALDEVTREHLLFLLLVPAVLGLDGQAPPCALSIP